jgi:hypothetical protein
MALDPYHIVRPGQQNDTGNIHALHIEEFTGLVQATLNRNSVLAPRIPTRAVKGTSTITNNAVGKSQLQVLRPGYTMDGTNNKFGRQTLTIDTVINARAVLPLLETFQTHYDARALIATEHGKEHAKFYDQTFFIQAIKAGLLTDNRFGLTGDTGHTGGTQVTMNSAGDEKDPAILYAKIVELITGMRKKDVDPVTDGVILGISHDDYATLSMNELLINSEYVTAEGTRIPQMVLKAHGVAVIPSQNIVGHKLSNADNGNAYDGDFTDVLAVAWAPAALMAGETIALQSKVFFDDISKHWFVDAWRSFGVAPSVAAFAGVIKKKL